MAIVDKRVPKVGYEQFYELAVKKLETVDEEVAHRIEEETAKEKATLNAIIEESSVVVQVEVPDETIEGQKQEQEEVE